MSNQYLIDKKIKIMNQSRGEFLSDYTLKDVNILLLLRVKIKSKLREELLGPVHEQNPLINWERVLFEPFLYQLEPILDSSGLLIFS